MCENRNISLSCLSMISMPQIVFVISARLKNGQGLTYERSTSSNHLSRLSMLTRHSLLTQTTHNLNGSGLLPPHRHHRAFAATTRKTNFEYLLPFTKSLVQLRSCLGVFTGARGCSEARLDMAWQVSRTWLLPFSTLYRPRGEVGCCALIWMCQQGGCAM